MKQPIFPLFLFLLGLVFLFTIGCGAVATSQPTNTPVPSTATSIPPTATWTVSPTILPSSTPTPHPITVHLSSDGKGDFSSLGIAVETLAPGSTIILGEGTFSLTETLFIDKPLTIEGSGRDKTIVAGEGALVTVRYSGEGLFTIRDITFRREGNMAATVMAILGGEVHFSNCRFTNGAANNDDTISGDGLVFLHEAIGVVENCEIDGNHGSGVLVVGRAKPELISNDIHDNGESGILFHLEEDGGLAEMNDLSNNNTKLTDSKSRGTDIIIFDNFAPVLISNSCSSERLLFDSPFGGDWSGIVFISTHDLPDTSKAQENDCAIARCSTATGSLLNLSCR